MLLHGGELLLHIFRLMGEGFRVLLCLNELLGQIVRAALSQMDVPTRSSYVMAVVTEAECTAAASFTSVPRSLAASLSPAIAGALFSLSWQASPLIVCGALKIAYDLLLLNQFRCLKPPEERCRLLHNVRRPHRSSA